MKEPTLPGKLLYHLYHSPRRKISSLFQKGLKATVEEYLFESRMKCGAEKLRYTSSGAKIPRTIHFLSGSAFWHQTLYCVYSLLTSAKLEPRIEIWDDGTLTLRQKRSFTEFCCDIVVHSPEEIRARLDKHLPHTAFPYLRKRRESYPHLRKLTDIHCGNSGWQLVLDSDMLFYREPNQLLTWMKDPQNACYLVDAETSYGYDFSYLQTFIEEPLLEKVNVGLVGLLSESIDWDLIEFWCRKMIDEHGTHYTQEQALTALILSKQGGAISLPAADYMVLPSEAEVRNPSAVLHHYVAGSKSWYFRYGWQQIG